MDKIKLLLLVVNIFNTISFGQTTLAPFITKCKSVDAECMKSNAVVAIPILSAGIPEMGVATLDPMYVGFVNASKLGLKFYVNDIKLYGFKYCKPIDIHRDMPKSKIYVDLLCGGTCEGQYDLSGKVLALDIRGRGKLYCKLREFEINVDMDVEDVMGKDSKTHFNIKHLTYTFDLKKKSDVVFENLFEGNKEMSSAANEVIKNSGNEIVREIGDPIFHAAVSEIIKNVNNFLGAIPKEDLTLDD